MIRKSDARLSLIAAAVSASALALVACASPASTDAGAPDAGVLDCNPYDLRCCHIDCFGRVSCSDGIVTVEEARPVHCDSECIHRTHPCKKGCRTDRVDWSRSEYPPNLCEENRPKAEGDPCSEEDDCQPQATTSIDGGVFTLTCDSWTGLCVPRRSKQPGDPCEEDLHCDPQIAERIDGGVVNVYLACDADAGACVNREPTVYGDYLEPLCQIEEAGPAQMNSFSENDHCSGGACWHEITTGCVMQGCVAVCSGDDDCPMGSVCETGFCRPYGMTANQLFCPDE